MKRSLLSITVFAVTTLTSNSAWNAQAAPDINIVGRWASMETSKGGIGAIFVFHDDGTLDYSPAAVVAGHYRLEGSKLLSTSGTATNPESASIIESLTEKKLEMTLPPAIELVRDGDITDTRNPIWGTWKNNDGGNSLTWQFRADGTQSSSTPGAISGPYRLAENRLILSSDTMKAPDLIMLVMSLTARELRLAPLMVLTREDRVADERNLIVGTWQSAGLMLPLTRRFSADGTDLLAAPFRIEKGTYKILNGRIRIEIGGNPVEGNVRLENGVLVIPSPSGRGEAHFARY